MKRIIVILIALSLVSTYAIAGPKSGRGHSETSSEKSAVQAVGDETAEAVAEVLTGKETTTTTTTEGKLPPGLAKKGKTPPGWDKGKKTGWSKTETTTTESDSPIKQFIKGLFGKKTQQTTTQTT